MKKFIKTSIFLLVMTIALFNDNNVYAAKENWPGVNSSMIPNAYKDMEYCVYNVSGVKTVGSDFWNDSKLYSNTSYILIYDNNNNDIKFLGEDGVPRTTVDRFKWNNRVWPAADQYVSFSGNLYDYMVKDDELQCNKLYFLEVGSSGFNNNGSLEVSTGVSEFYSTMEEGTERYKYLDSLGITGTHYGENLCKVNLAKFNEISTNYYNKLPDTLDALYTLSKADYVEGNSEKVTQLYNEYKKLVTETQNSLSQLKLVDNENGDGFWPGKCNNSLLKDYKTLISKIKIGLNNAENASKEISKKIEEAKNSQKITEEEYNKAKNEAEKLAENIAEAKTEWENYLTSIKMGNKITDQTCEGLLGNDLLDDISTVLTWIRIAVPIIVILLGSLDFSRAVLSDDQQELKKAGSRFVKRCIIAVAIFFVPSIIMYLLSFIDKIYDVSCDIRLW